MLLTKGYQPIKNVLPVEFINEAVFNIFEEIKITPPTYDVHRGLIWQFYKLEPTQLIAQDVKPRIEKILGEDLLFTYSFITVYTNNSYMSRHTDRDACEVSVSINLASTLDWKLQLQDLNGEHAACSTKAGDGVIYLGREVEHWRDLLVSYSPQFYIQTFFHYVRAKGKYKHLENDPQPSVHPVQDA